MDILDDYDERGTKWKPYRAPGPKAGSFSKNNIEKEPKTSRLTLRVSPTTIRKLHWVHEHSATYKGLSDSEIISRLIDEHLLMQQLFRAEAPKFK